MAMPEVPLSAWPELRDPTIRKILTYLAKNLYASPLKLSYDLKLGENQVADALKKLEEAGLVKLREPSQVARPGYGLTDLGVKLRPQLLEMESTQKRWLK